MERGSPRRLLFGVGAFALVVATIVFLVPDAGAHALGAHQATQTSSGVIVRTSNANQPLTRLGSENVRALAKQASYTSPTSSNERRLLGPEGSLTRTAGGSSAAGVSVTNLPVSGAVSSSGFPGITGALQAAANAAYDLEPPDQALCSNGSDVVEAVNNAYAVYTTGGAPALPPIAMTALFGIPSENAGSFTSDPRCYYDAATGRWFVVELSIPNYFTTHSSKSYELIAVSQSADPTGSFTTFAINSTDPGNPGCPCFGDYPMIGADAYGFYLTTNEFSLYRPNFNGVQIYAVSKQGLVAAANGAATPTVAHLGALPSPFPGEGAGETYHLSPALTPSDGAYATANGGIEYFTMSDAFPVSSNLLALYALTNTSSLASSTPALTLSSSVVRLGQSYQFPETGMAVPQRAATSSAQTPLLNYIEQQTGASVPEGVLQADFDAVEETTYTNGRVFTELSNASSPTASVGTTTAEWFILAPSVGSGGGLSTSLVNEGNIGVAGQSLLYPDIVVNGSGVGDMVFTLTGTKYFPSAAFVAFGSAGPTSQVHVAGAGSGPEDGFTCYAYYVGSGYGGCRWGDYSGGVAAGGTIWMATEYIPSASTRDFYTNWGTFIFRASAG